MSEGMFPQHPRSGDWQTLKGRTLAPHELPYDVQDSNDGPERLNQEVSGGYNWEASLVTGGEFDPNKLTSGTDKHMPK